MKTILYISTNNIWSGSEELWSRSASQLIDKGFTICFATKYDHEELKKLKGLHFNFLNRHPYKAFLKRAIERTTPFKFESRDLLFDFISAQSPHLIVISQGNNYESLDIMEYCLTSNIPYLTITQLVGDLFIWAFQDKKFATNRKVYLGAIKNYFVSYHNLELNNLMLGMKLPNAAVVYNPCKLTILDIAPFPEINHVYKVALVGRLDVWHKGLDLLVCIARMQKWKERPIQFNLYGRGDYTEFLKANIQQEQLKNINLKGHAQQIKDIWRENHLLFMPSRLEGQALALIEAMWCQRAAVVSDVGGAAELIDDGYNGFIAPAPTVDSLDEALERAWQRRDEWKNLGLNAGQTLAEKHPPDAVAYFNDLLEKHLAGLQ